MDLKVLAPGEDAPNRYMYVISHGAVMFGGRLLTRGGVWGDDVILTDERSFLPYLARALTWTRASRTTPESCLLIL